MATDLKFNVDFSLPALNATNFVTWEFYVDDSAKGKYNMILGKIFLLTELGLNLKFPEHIIKTDDGPF